jgi:hypothetical protein
MFTICKKSLCVLLLALIAGASLGCLTINGGPEKDREKDHRTEVKVGGDKGVVVEHPGGEH